MKILSLTTVLCLAATAIAVDTNNAKNVDLDTVAEKTQVQNHHVNGPIQLAVRPQGVMRHEEVDKKVAATDKKDAATDKKDAAADKKDDKKDDKKTDKKAGDADKKAGDGDKKTAGDADKKTTGDADKKTEESPVPPQDYASPIWLVQPFASSVWSQGTEYVIGWGPNPDPAFAKAVKDKAPIDIKLMQGPMDNLKEIAVLKGSIDSSTHQFTWKLPDNVKPAKDYSIRLVAPGVLDTYSHFFEIVASGDPRATKSNVGEPIPMPQVGDVPAPVTPHKGLPAQGVAGPPPPVNQGTPPPPPPAQAVVGDTPPPATAKPETHHSGAAGQVNGANIMAFAMTLFGAVYFL